MNKKLAILDDWIVRLRVLLFVCLFAGAGTLYLLASHAATDAAGFDLIGVVDTNGQPLDGVRVSITAAQNTRSCSSLNPSTNGQVRASCVISNVTDGTFTITGISAGGYNLDSSSQFKPGSSVLIRANQTLTYNSAIVMSPIPAPPTPPPTPTPTPTPTPPPTAPKSSSNSGTVHITNPVSVTPSSPTTTDTPATTNEVQPATNDTSGNLTAGSDINVPKDSKSSINSSDHLVKVTFPKGTFDKDAFCSIDNADGMPLPGKVANEIGPYNIDCADTDGNVLTNLNHAVTVDVSISGKGNYAAYINGSKWVITDSSRSGQTLSFKLAKNELFAAAAKKSTSPIIIIVDIGAVGIFILVIGFIVYLIRRRQQLDAPPTPGNYDQNYPSS
jgi:hypothetical protein